ncbi:MAG: DUF1653 domain-containing protein [Gammaproteobacteria bacterium]|nr:DUF1653 domain-containing protein [Gammaproteobacteria bacterium]
MSDSIQSIRNGLYRHFKGNYYQVTGVVRHSETAESLVIYRAIYGEKSSWARPLSMFNELIERDGRSIRRFSYCEDQNDVLELALLDVLPECQAEFETAFAEAQNLMSKMDGYISHQLQRCLEKNNRYVLLVEWQSLDHHIVGFRKSANYQKWRKLLHRFYKPFPEVQHFQRL